MLAQILYCPESISTIFNNKIYLEDDKETPNKYMKHSGETNGLHAKP